MDRCEFCDLVRKFFALIKECLKEEKVEIKVASSVRVDPVIGAKPK